MEKHRKGSSTTNLSCTKKDIFYVLRYNIKDTFDRKVKLLTKYVSKKSGHSVEIGPDMKNSLKLLFDSLRTRWGAAYRKESTFLKNNADWLNGAVQFSKLPNDNWIISTPFKGKRKSTSLSQSSAKSKKRKTEGEILGEDSLTEWTPRTRRGPRTLDRGIRVIEDLRFKSPSKALEYITALKSSIENKFSADQALSVLVENQFSNQTYRAIRKVAKESRCTLYPSYKEVKAAKSNCYPPKYSFSVTKNSVQVNLQDLLDHTVNRILLSQEDSLKTLPLENVKNIKLYCKWGCSEDKQQFNGDGKLDGKLIFTSLVPLRLVGTDDRKKDEIIIWTNPRPSSPRFCRPIKIQFSDHDAKSTPNEVADIENEIKNLETMSVDILGNAITVKYEMILTITDERVCNSNTSSTLRCLLCKASSQEFNDVDKMINRTVNVNNLKFGISTRHIWNRTFEHILNMPHKLSSKKLQGPKEGSKKKSAERKSLQNAFSSQLGLVPNHPPLDFGSMNDDKTARRFFRNAKESAKVTGVSQELIQRLHSILQVMSSGCEVDETKFEEYCIETAQQYVSEYSWNQMPISLHMLLIHGPQFVANALLPIGQISEAVKRNINTSFHHEFSKNPSSTSYLKSIFHKLLVNSDPHISSVRKLPQQSVNSMTLEAMQLVKRTELPTEDNISLSSNSSDSESNSENESEAESMSESDED